MSSIKRIPLRELPDRLSEIPQPPGALFVRGTLPVDDAPWLAIVGTRKASPYGTEAVESIVRGLAGSGITIVSGLALGTDGNAHRAALTAGLPTVAILGAGLSDKTLYPRTHTQLAHDILAAGGALLSEYEPEVRARAEYFPARNRIMAGLAHAVLIVEADMRSGTMITARLATDYNRDVLAVPGSIFSPLTAGPHYLIKNGAMPVRTADDVCEMLGIERTRTTTSHAKLSENERRVLALVANPLPRNELIAALSMETHEANTLLAAMELKGLIRERLGLVRICE